MDNGHALSPTASELSINIATRYPTNPGIPITPGPRLKRTDTQAAFFHHFHPHFNTPHYVSHS